MNIVVGYLKLGYVKIKKKLDLSNIFIVANIIVSVTTTILVWVGYELICWLLKKKLAYRCGMNPWLKVNGMCQECVLESSFIERIQANLLPLRLHGEVSFL